MTTPHPVHALRTALEGERLKAVETLAAQGGSVPPDALRQLATLQMALMAVREDIEVLGNPLGRHRLGDHDEAFVEVPADDHLCGRAAMAGGDGTNHRIGQC